MLLAVSCVAQEPAPATPKPNYSSVRLDAKGTGNGSHTTHNWESGWGSYQREYDKQSAVEALVGTSGRTEVAVKIDWIFVGKTLYKNKRIAIGHGTKAVTITPGPDQHVPLTSGEIHSTDNNYVALGERTVSGSKIEGWIIRLLDNDGRLIAAKASADYLDKIARDPKAIEELLHAPEP